MAIIRGVHGSGGVRFVPNPDSTRMRRVDEKLTRNRPGDLVGFFGLGLIGFGVIQVGLGFYHRGRNMVGSGEIKLKYGRIRWDQVEIWPESSRSGRNMVGFSEIKPKSGRIRRDLAQISSDKGENLPDLEGSRLDFVENGRKVVITRWKEKEFGLGRVSRVSKGKTDNWLAWGWGSEFETRVRPLESSDRMVASRTRAGWPSWAGHQVCWTPLAIM